MQKKIIALAVAGLVSGAAFAQTNVTVYGMIDMGYVYQGDAAMKGVDSYNAVDSNGWDTSRFGLKGTEDLGNGLSVAFQQEYGLTPDVNGSTTFQRPSWVSLNGKGWGSIQAGNFFIDSLLFNTKGGFGAETWGAKVVDQQIFTWASNAVRFNSLDYSGFSGSLGYSSDFGYLRNDSGAPVDNQNEAIWGDLKYSNGGLFVGASYTYVNNDALNANADEWSIGASYDFKVANVGLIYTDTSIDRATGLTDYDRQAWRLNVGIPVTAKDDVYLSYSAASLDPSNTNDDHNAWGFGIGYTHAMSKRTKLYAAANIANTDGDGFLTVNTSGVNTVTTYQNGVKFGVNHTF